MVLKRVEGFSQPFLFFERSKPKGKILLKPERAVV